MKFQERLQQLGFDTYSDYLAGSHWQEFKSSYRASGLPMRCSVCSGGPIQLHHHTYKHLGSERLSDVTPLCRLHHEEVHTILKQKSWFVDKTSIVVKQLRPTAAKKNRKHREPKQYALKGNEALYDRLQRRKVLAERKAKIKRKAKERAERDAERLANDFPKIVASIRQMQSDGVKHQLVPENYTPVQNDGLALQYEKWLRRAKNKPQKIKTMACDALVVNKKQRDSNLKKFHEDAAGPMADMLAIAAGFRRRK